jgi:mRNA interferase RelE/StbE
MPWRLIVAAPAERSLGKLTEAVAGAIVEFMLGPIVEAPTVVGKPLQRELSGYWSARRGSYRVIYRLDDDQHEIVVICIEHRSDVYRRR